ncbi:hypothetical protein QJS66_15505 [Kocuria rhizophila]|nr:hypothetical protein QJS66_15505 [Kocuria rhizophila]
MRADRAPGRARAQDPRRVRPRERGPLRGQVPAAGRPPGSRRGVQQVASRRWCH